MTITVISVALVVCYGTFWSIKYSWYRGHLTRFNVVFAYRDHGIGPHTVTLSLLQVMWSKFCRFKSNPKFLLQN